MSPARRSEQLGARAQLAPHPHRRPEARLCRLAGGEPNTLVEREAARVAFTPTVTQRR